MSSNKIVQATFRDTVKREFSRVWQQGLCHIYIENEDYVNRLTTLKGTLLDWNHSHMFLDKVHMDALEVDSNEAIKPCSKTTTATTPPRTTKFSHALPNIKDILTKYYSLLNTNQKLIKIFTKPPKVFQG